MKDNPVITFLAIVAVIIAVIFLFSSCQGNIAQQEIEEETVKAVDVVNVDELPTIDFDEDGEATMLDAGATANLMYNMMLEDNKEDEMYTKAILTMSDQHQDTITKNVRNMAWAPAAIVGCIALIVIALVVLYWLAKGSSK